jgi:hypothetical protein
MEDSFYQFQGVVHAYPIVRLWNFIGDSMLCRHQLLNVGTAHNWLFVLAVDDSTIAIFRNLNFDLGSRFDCYWAWSVVRLQARRRLSRRLCRTPEKDVK